MKRFLLSALSLVCTVSAQSYANFNLRNLPPSAKNISDFSSKGIQTISGLQDLIFAMEFNLQTVDGATKAMSQLTSLEQYVDYYAASGFAAIFSEQYQPNEVVASLQYISNHFQWVSAFNGHFAKIFQTLPDYNQCQTDMLQAQANLNTALGKLYAYSNSKVTSPDQSEQLAVDFVNFCTQNKCDQILYNFLSYINGEFTQNPINCEMTQWILQGVSEQKLYKGRRDLSINMVSALLNQALIAMTVQSAFYTLDSFRLDGWQAVQDYYGQQLKVAFQRIHQFDYYLQANLIHNAEYSVNYLFTQPLTLSNQQLSDQLQLYLQKNYPSKYWIVATYSGQLNSVFAYYTCQDCFSFTYFYNKYNIVVFGVTKTSKPNTKLLLLDAWKTYIQTFTDSMTLVNNLNGQTQYCFKGILSLMGDQNLALNGGSQQNIYHSLAENQHGKTLVIATDEPCQQNSQKAEEMREIEENIKGFLD